ncbi:MAG: tetratricopeptide repeat protein [Proteobacteria bacterium]|nr:tetratricopeptide repeat protein [Pseudomonadota bacterium]
MLRFGLKTVLPYLAGIALMIAIGATNCHADQTDERLGTLFIDLQETTDRRVAKLAESEIWAIWHESPDKKSSEIMRNARRALDENDFDSAIAIINALVEHAPEFAEAWNQRAIVLYLAGDFPGALRDIEQTLMLEPRHFGALSGRAQVYLQLDEPELALEAFESALERNPWMDNIREQIAMVRAYMKSKQKPI